MLLRTLYDDKLAQASYLIGCQATGEAIVVDPNRDAQQYIRAARKEGLRITHVTETHIHADFLSGTRELAQATGAKMYLSAEGGSDWQYAFATPDNAVLLHDGDSFNVGNIRFDVLHTPGHTPEHICFLVTDTRSADKPMGLLSGDFVFVGDVGRPDLLEKAAGVSGTMRAGAKQLYQSLERFRELPDYLQVWPGHGAGSACGKALGAVPQTTVGYEKQFSVPFSFTSEDEFVDYILSGQPEPPRYFATMKRFNREGPAIIGKFAEPRELSADEFNDLLQKNTTIVDTRHSIAFAKAHVPGTINIPYNKAFTNWAGALLSYDSGFALIADPKVVPEIARDLGLIGLDNGVGYLPAEAVGARASEKLPVMKTADMNANGDALLLDVRTTSEFENGHIDGALNIPLQQIANRWNEVPRDKPVVVHCQGGGRAAIASSLLKSKGYDVTNVQGGYDEWVASGRPTVSEKEVAAH